MALNRDQHNRGPIRWLRLATSVLAAALVTTACSGQTSAPGTPSGATSRPSVAQTAAEPSATLPTPPLPGGRLVYEHLIGDVGELLTTNPDGTDTALLLPAAVGPRWSPDGRRISVVADNRQGLVFVGLIDPDGTNYVQFDSPDPTLNLGCFTWSPDASRLACEAWDETDLTRNGIYTVRSSDGGDLVRVTTSPDGGHDIPTDYSPDGRQIAFTRQRLPDESNVTLMVVNIDGSDGRALTDRRIGGGRWSPDGETILTDAHGSLLLVPLDGSAVQTFEIAADATLNPAAPAWSPDGEWIAFSGHNPNGFDLYIVRRDGTNLHRLTDTAREWEGAVDWAAGP